MTGIDRLRLPALIMFLITAGFSACRSSLSPRSGAMNARPQAANSAQDLPACVTEERMLKIRGDSLSGLIEDGAVMKIIMGYYKCHEVGRDNIVVYNYPVATPLAKIARGIPGDEFRLKKYRPGCWSILINGKILKNSKKTPYCISEHGYRMLSLYEKTYSGIIPKDAVLIFGNQPEGTLDSTSFGLVGRVDLLGRAMPLAGDRRIDP